MNLLLGRHAPRGWRGFTLIEMVMVVAVVAILAAIAAPSMRDFIRAAAVRDAASELYAALIAARSEAIKRRANVVVARASGVSWASGWTVSTGGTTLQTKEALSTDVSVSTNINSDITYGSNGRVSSGAQTVVFYVSASPSIQARCVGIDSTSGLPRMRTDTNRNYADGCN